MSDNGWIKAHRKLIDWEWYDDSKLVHLYLHCLLKANHKPKKWRGVTIESGQFITSYQSLSDQLPLSVQQIRTAINKLKSTGEITVKKTNKYSMISITNWSDYQLINTQDNKQVTDNQQTSNKQVTTNKNEKNDKKKTKGFIKPTIPEIKAYFAEKQYNLDADEFFNHYEANGWMRGKTKIVSWKACARTWLKNNKNDKPANVVPMPKEFTGWENER